MRFFKRNEVNVLSEISDGIKQMKYGSIVVDMDNSYIITHAGRGFYELSGYSSADISGGLPFSALFNGNPRVFEKVRRMILKNIEQRGESCISFFMSKKDGKEIHVNIHCTLDFNLNNGHNILKMVIADDSDNERRDTQLKIQNERYRIIDENTDEIYFDYDVLNDVMHLPKKYFETVAKKYPMSNYWGKNSPKLTIHPDDYKKYKEAWDICLSRQESRLIEFRTKAFSQNESYEWFRLPLASITDDSGRVVAAFGRLYSIQKEKLLSEKVSTDKKIIEKLSTTDALTGLYNRNTFKLKAAEKLKDFDESRCYALIYSDINDFSYINDNFGYDEGNRVLCDFARLVEGNSEDIISCRIYSDYFLTFCIGKNIDEIIGAASGINNIFTASLKEKYPASDIHISTGIYFFDKNNLDVTIAIDNANLARRSVKGSKDVPCGIYSEGLRKKRRHDQKIASELHAAIQNGYIEVFLQPKFSLATREITGAEALARWRQPDGTYKLPYEFIEVLEKVGYVVELDYFIYEQVLMSLKKWKDAGKKLVPVSVNFSRLHNSRSDFVNTLIDLAEKYDVDKSYIEIEVTESAFAADVNTMARNMSKLRDAGFKIDIDDFGIGYSSLSLLMTAPIDTVKVDKIFIDNIATSKDHREYVKQMCKLISTTRKDVVFEGVETEEQANCISEWGFNIAQGWLFDKAISVSDFETKYLNA